MPERLYGDERCENITCTLLRTVTEYLAHNLVRNMSWLRSRCYKLANTKARWETTSLLHDIRSSVFHTHCQNICLLYVGKLYIPDNAKVPALYTIPLEQRFPNCVPRYMNRCFVTKSRKQKL
jgi:hypothetical protein